MKVNPTSIEFDATDLEILELLQENCKQPLAAIGQKVGLSAPSVLERIHKLEEAGVVIGYTAILDARKLGRDITAFIGVATERARDIARIEREVVAIDAVLECHHVTGEWTLMLKVKTQDTESLEDLERLRRYAVGLGKHDVDVDVELGFGSPVRVIPEIVRRHGVELLVVGAHGHKGFSDWVYGSTIDELRHRLNISVLVVGRPGDGPG